MLILFFFILGLLIAYALFMRSISKELDSAINQAFDSALNSKELKELNGGENEDE